MHFFYIVSHKPATTNFLIGNWLIVTFGLFAPSGLFNSK